MAFNNWGAATSHTFLVDNISMCPVDVPPTIVDYHNPDIVSHSDYYAFGANKPGTKWSTGSGTSYRFGFNGQEKTTEINIGVNDTYYRLYDSRIGRWFSTDPIVFPFESPYIAISDNPIAFSDPLGDRIIASAEDRRNIRYLRKHDAEFKKKWDEIKKQYGGRKNPDLVINKDLNSPDLNHADVDKTNKDGSDPLKEKRDYLYYNGKLDNANYEVTEVLEEQEGGQANIPAHPHGDDKNKYSQKTNLSTTMPNFDHWSYRIVKQRGFEYMLDYQNVNYLIESVVWGDPKSKTTIAIMNLHNTNPAHVHDQDHEIGPGAVYATWYYRAMSKPRVMNVDRTRHGWDYRNMRKATGAAVGKRTIDFSTKKEVK